MRGLSIKDLDDVTISEGQQILVAGYPSGTTKRVTREAVVYLKRTQNTSVNYTGPAWIAVLKGEQPVVSGMSGGLVIDPGSFELLGVLVSSNSPADLDGDGNPDQSFDFVSIGDVSRSVAGDSAAYFCDVSVTTTPKTQTFTKNLLVREPEPYFSINPASFQTVSEAVIVQEGAPEGSSFKTITETVTVQEAFTELIAVPATWETVERTTEFGNYNGKAYTGKYNFERIAQQPEVASRTVPSVKKQITKRVVDVPGNGTLQIPSVQKVESRRVVSTPASSMRAHSCRKNRKGYHALSKLKKASIF